MMPPKRHKQEDNVDSWLMSYADMITLLLAFFVIFVAISEPKSEKMQALTESMTGQFGTIDLATPFQGTYKTLMAVVEDQQIFKDLDIQRTKNGISIEMARGAFFAPESAELDPTKLDTLKDIAKAIKGIDFLDYRVSIEGHSNDNPPKNGAYASNWEFTTAQASRLARFFIEQGIPANRLKVAGYADTEPKVPNSDLQGNPIPQNQEQNARIQIMVERQL